jgi:hypothetical protein
MACQRVDRCLIAEVQLGYLVWAADLPYTRLERMYRRLHVLLVVMIDDTQSPVPTQVPNSDRHLVLQ